MHIHALTEFDVEEVTQDGGDLDATEGEQISQGRDVDAGVVDLGQNLGDVEIWTSEIRKNRNCRKYQEPQKKQNKMQHE